MRVFMTSFAALLALVAFGPGVTTALGGDNGPSVGSPGVAGAPAIPPVPASVPGRTFAPAPLPVPAPTPASVPAPTLAPAPVLSPTPAGQIRDDVGNPGITQTSDANVNAGVAVNQNGEQWRYRWHRNNWWYWTPANRWVYRNGNEWVNYEPAVTAAPAVDYSNQPAYYQSSPNGNYPGPYSYSTGYRGYYGPVYQGGYYGPAYQGGYYYGSGGYYGQPGISFGLGFRRGFRIGW